MIGGTGTNESYPFGRGVSIHQIQLDFRKEIDLYHRNWTELSKSDSVDSDILRKKDKIDEIWAKIQTATNSVKKSEYCFEMTTEMKQFNTVADSAIQLEAERKAQKELFMKNVLAAISRK